jgi:hypothetical protein
MPSNSKCGAVRITALKANSLSPHHPVTHRYLLPLQLDQLQPHSGFIGLPADVALYWADGQRTLAQILDLVELETGVRDAEGLTSYFKLLERLELVELRRE